MNLRAAARPFRTVSRRLRTVSRRLSSFYDSQSGLHVEIPTEVTIHALAPPPPLRHRKAAPPLLAYIEPTHDAAPLPFASAEAPAEWGPVDLDIPTALFAPASTEAGPGGHACRRGRF